MSRAARCGIKYFIPDWDDRYDPFFDFVRDDYSDHHKVFADSDVYAHELLNIPPYDGILYSLGNLLPAIYASSSIDMVSLKGYSNIHDYFHLDKASTPLEVFGDCGAFNYVNLDRPPERATPQNISFLYNKLGFDYGVSVDHLVVETVNVKKNGQKIKRVLTSKEKEERIKISLENAEQFIKACKDNNYCFVPVGSAQGDSPESYRESVGALVEMGYDYIALGGLVRRRTQDILEIVKTVSPCLKGRRLHLLGVVRTDCLQELKKLGVTSVDSASFFRKAWLRSNQNYIASNGKIWYAAVRVPILNDPRTRVKNLVEARELEALEKECLKVLHAYGLRKICLDRTLDVLMSYDSMFVRNGDDGGNLRLAYARTLDERPWEKCPCPICRELGIHVIIFRKTNRNKRRGLHNTWVLYNILNSILDESKPVTEDQLEYAVPYSFSQPV